MSSAIGIVIAILAAYAAQAAAQRKGRHMRRWLVACVVFSPSLLLLEVLPNKNQPSDAGSIAPVPSRGPFSKIPPRWVEIVGVVAVLFGLASVVYSFSQSDFPTCDSGQAHSQVTDLAKQKLSKVISSFSSVQALESPSSERKCSAAVMLSDNSTHTIYYRYYNKDGKLYLFTKFDTPLADTDR